MVAAATGERERGKENVTVYGWHYLRPSMYVTEGKLWCDGAIGGTDLQLSVFLLIPFFKFLDILF